MHTCVREKHSCAYIVIYPFCICSSPLKVKEDDEVDKLEININNPKRSKRTYASPSPEVAMKISRSLRVSNIFYTSVHMRLYLDPELRAQRVAAIKVRCHAKCFIGVFLLNAVVDLGMFVFPQCY